MNLGDLRTNFLALLNRSDCTPAQANIFLGQGLQRLQREVRLPSMERLVVIQPAAPLTLIPIPDDLIQPIDILVMNTGWMPGYDIGAMVALTNAGSYRDLQRLPQSGIPRAYARYQADFQIAAPVPMGAETHLWYYGEFSPLNSDTDENEITASSPDLCVYAALAMAGDFFDSPKAQTWEARYQQFRDQVADLATAVDMNGGYLQVSSAYGECY